MLIGICGGLCAGKHTVLDYLVQQHRFHVLTLAPPPRPEEGTGRGGSKSLLDDVPDPSRARHAETIFVTADELLQHATLHWQTSFVTTATTDREDVVETLSARPFFVLLHIDAPVTRRCARFQARCERAGRAPPTLEQFVRAEDERLYDAGAAAVGAGAKLAARAQIKLLNGQRSVAALWTALDALELTDTRRTRPSWDHYFMMLASLAARRSNCMRRQVGCVLVRGRRVMATGYNGTARQVRNCNEGGCPRCNGTTGGGGAALSTCLCLHAEENALLEAGRERVGDGAVLYCNTCPCLTCTIKIVQVGITEVVYSQSYYMDVEAARIFEQAGVKLRQFSPPQEGLVSVMDGPDEQDAQPVGHSKA